MAGHSFVELVAAVETGKDQQDRLGVGLGMEREGTVIVLGPDQGRQGDGGIPSVEATDLRSADLFVEQVAGGVIWTTRGRTSHWVLGGGSSC
jgi:hypothetical protein